MFLEWIGMITVTMCVVGSDELEALAAHLDNAQVMTRGPYRALAISLIFGMPFITTSSCTARGRSGGVQPIVISAAKDIHSVDLMTRSLRHNALLSQGLPSSSSQNTPLFLVSR